jgi:hypothetical protein
MSSIMTLLVFSVVIAAVLAIIGTPLLIVACLIIARMTGANTGRRRTGRGRRVPAAPDRGRDRTSVPPFAGGRRRDEPRPRAASERGGW